MKQSLSLNMLLEKIQQTNLQDFSPHYPFLRLALIKEAMKTVFKVFGKTRRKNRTQVYQL